MIAASLTATTSVPRRAETETDSFTSDHFVLPASPEKFVDHADEYRNHVIEMLRQSGAEEKLLGAMLADPTDNSTPEPEATSSLGEFPPRIIEFMETVGGWDVDLRDALSDLDEAPAEAREEEFPVPSTHALANARRLLRAVYKLSPQRFEVYPTPDGEVAIDAPGGYGRSVLLLCDSDGGALCLVNMDGRHRRARYSDTGSLPDGFVREALEGLARRDELAA